MMPEKIRKYLFDSICQLDWQIDLPIEKIHIKQNVSQVHGDFSSNIALQLAKPLSMEARAVAQDISKKLESIEEFDKIEIAGPGFINIFIKKAQRYTVVENILVQGENYAQGVPNGKRILVEFVSANPTGPLHVGHGRGAVYGDSLVRLLKKSGCQVDAEYYVNDAGRQIEILTISVFLRYVEKYTPLSADIFQKLYSSNTYQGEYIIHIADQFARQLNEAQKNIINKIDYQPFLTDYQEKYSDKKDVEHYIDQLIAFIKQILGEEYKEILVLCKTLTLDEILQNIENDLQETSVDYNRWFSEQSLVEDGSVSESLESLKEGNKVYQKDGATWFKSTEFGDDKDRVLVRQDGFKTYLMHDIAYHKNKFDRGYDQMIDVWGADHHGYIARMKSAMQSLGYDASKLCICLVQFANLYRGEEKVAMSTRSGDFVPLRQLREEVGNDAMRFFYNLNRSDQHLNFDLQLALEKSNDNPVFYVQYAYARIQSIFQRLKERGYTWQSKDSDLNLLDVELEGDLMRTLSMYPQKIQDAASKNMPHMITLYVRELAAQVHQYYNKSTILVAESALRNARLDLLFSSGVVIKDALSILGVSAPEKM